uniref:Putative secreted protein n=1 Tax=Lutzomyia longipalpis TaxID=7200 RepID=A0A7G3AKL7_LUTLO
MAVNVPCVLFGKLWFVFVIILGAFVLAQIHPTETRVIYYNGSLPLDTTTDVAPTIQHAVFETPFFPCGPNQMRDDKGRCRNISFF